MFFLVIGGQAVNAYGISRQTGDLVTDVDLYVVRTSTNSAIVATNDYYSGSLDAGAALIQSPFFSPSSDVGTNTTDTVGAADLLTALNAAYDGGAGAGQYVFMRLSYANTWPSTSGT